MEETIKVFLEATESMEEIWEVHGKSNSGSTTIKVNWFNVCLEKGDLNLYNYKENAAWRECIKDPLEGKYLGITPGNELLNVLKYHCYWLPL